MFNIERSYLVILDVVSSCGWKCWLSVLCVCELFAT